MVSVPGFTAMSCKNQNVQAALMPGAAAVPVIAAAKPRYQKGIKQAARPKRRTTQCL